MCKYVQYVYVFVYVFVYASPSWTWWAWVEGNPPYHMGAAVNTRHGTMCTYIDMI